MYLRDSLYVLARRWYVVVPLVLVLAVGVIFLTRTTPYSYSGKASVVLLSPSVKSTNEPTASNPYLAFSGNLDATAAVLVRILTDEDSAQTLTGSGATAAYTVGPDPTTPNAPLLAIETKDHDPVVAARTMDALIVLLQSQLKEQQTKARAPAELFITAAVVSHMSPERDSTAKKTVAAVGLAVSLVLPLLTAFAVEGAAFRRGRRRTGEAQADSAGASAASGSHGDIAVPSPSGSSFPRADAQAPRYAEQPTIRTSVSRPFRSDSQTETVAGVHAAPAESPVPAVSPVSRGSGAARTSASSTSSKRPAAESPVRPGTASPATRSAEDRSGRPADTTSPAADETHTNGSPGQDADWNGLVELETGEFSRRILPKR